MGDWPEGAMIQRAHWHFHARLYERYSGMILDPGGFSDILRQLKDGSAVPLKRDGFAVQVRRRGKKTRWVYVIAAPNRDGLITVREPKHGMREAVKDAKAERGWPDPGMPRLLAKDEVAQ